MAACAGACSSDVPQQESAPPAAQITCGAGADCGATEQSSDFVWIRTDHRRIEGNPKLEQQDASDRAKCEKVAKAKAPNDQTAMNEAFKVCREKDGYIIVTGDEAVQLVR
jgi:hypothetical protein